MEDWQSLEKETVLIQLPVEEDGARTFGAVINGNLLADDDRDRVVIVKELLRACAAVDVDSGQPMARGVVATGNEFRFDIQTAYRWKDRVQGHVTQDPIKLLADENDQQAAVHPVCTFPLSADAVLEDLRTPASLLRDAQQEDSEAAESRQIENLNGVVVGQRYVPKQFLGEGDDVYEELQARNDVYKEAARAGGSRQQLRDIRARYQQGTADYKSAMSNFKAQTLDRLCAIMRASENLDGTSLEGRRFYRSLSREDRWPTVATTANNLSVFGNAVSMMFRLFQVVYNPGDHSAIMMLALVVGWSSAQFSWNKAVSLLLAGKASAGKSYVLLAVRDMLFPGQTSMPTVRSVKTTLTNTDEVYKCRICEEASPKTFGLNSATLKETPGDESVKATMTNGLVVTERNLYQGGVSIVARSVKRLMVSAISATNCRLPEPNNPLLLRHMVVEVPESRDEEKVRDKMLRFSFSTGGPERDTLKRKCQVTSYLIFLVFRAIEMGVFTVNMDLFNTELRWYLEYLEKKYSFDCTEPKRLAHAEQVARTLTVWYAVHCAFFTEEAQAQMGGNQTNILEQPELLLRVEPYLFCTREIAAFTMSLTGQIFLPKIRTDIVDNIRKMVRCSQDKFPNNFLYVRQPGERCSIAMDLNYTRVIVDDDTTVGEVVRTLAKNTGHSQQAIAREVFGVMRRTRMTMQQYRKDEHGVLAVDGAKPMITAPVLLYTEDLSPGTTAAEQLDGVVSAEATQQPDRLLVRRRNPKGNAFFIATHMLETSGDEYEQPIMAAIEQSGYNHQLQNTEIMITAFSCTSLVTAAEKIRFMAQHESDRVLNAAVPLYENQLIKVPHVLRPAYVKRQRVGRFMLDANFLLPSARQLLPGWGNGLDRDNNVLNQSSIYQFSMDMEVHTAQLHFLQCGLDTGDLKSVPVSLHDRIRQWTGDRGHMHPDFLLAEYTREYCAKTCALKHQGPVRTTDSLLANGSSSSARITDPSVVGRMARHEHGQSYVRQRLLESDAADRQELPSPKSGCRRRALDGSPDKNQREGKRTRSNKHGEGTAGQA